MERFEALIPVESGLTIFSLEGMYNRGKLIFLSLEFNAYSVLSTKIYLDSNFHLQFLNL